MELQQCQHLLQTAFHAGGNPENLSQITTSARGNHKSECVQAFGGFKQIQTFLSEQKPSEHNAAPTNTSECDIKLINSYIKDFSQKNNLSKLATQARGNKKTECLKEL